jgi:hypothetical protein
MVARWPIRWLSVHFQYVILRPERIMGKQQIADEPA